MYVTNIYTDAVMVGTMGESVFPSDPTNSWTYLPDGATSKDLHSIYMVPKENAYMCFAVGDSGNVIKCVICGLLKIGFSKSNYLPGR